MPEKYNFELDSEMRKSMITDTVVRRNNMLIFVNQMGNNGTFCKEYSPAPEFYVIHKNYYPNGNLKSWGKYLGKYVLTGNWYYYDENGDLKKEINEDTKFGKVDSKWILIFLEKEGYIDLKTGKGREEVNYNDSGRGYIKNGVFSLKFFRTGEYSIERNKYPFWVITIEASPNNHFNQTRYWIHGDTGDVLSKEMKQILRHE